MITQITLGLVIVALFILLAWEKYENKKERSRWINAVIAKTPEQYRDLELTDKVKPIEPKMEPDLIPENEVTDDEFKELIEKEVI